MATERFSCCHEPCKPLPSLRRPEGKDLVGTDLPSNQNSIRFFCHLFGHYLQRRGFNESL